MYHRFLGDVTNSYRLHYAFNTVCLIPWFFTNRCQSFHQAVENERRFFFFSLLCWQGDPSFDESWSENLFHGLSPQIEGKRKEARPVHKLVGWSDRSNNESWPFRAVLVYDWNSSLGIWNGLGPVVLGSPIGAHYLFVCLFVCLFYLLFLGGVV